METLNCPNCSAALSFLDDCDETTCPYCGTSIRKNDSTELKQMIAQCVGLFETKQRGKLVIASKELMGKFPKSPYGYYYYLISANLAEKPYDKYLCLFHQYKNEHTPFDESLLQKKKQEVTEEAMTIEEVRKETDKMVAKEVHKWKKSFKISRLLIALSVVLIIGGFLLCLPCKSPAPLVLVVIGIVMFVVGVTIAIKK